MLPRSLSSESALGPGKETSMNAMLASSSTALALALGLGTAAAATAQDPAAALDAYIESNRLRWEVPGLAVAVVHKGQLVLAKGYGVRQLGEAGAVDEDTLFSIGSTTKAMTAATLGLSVDVGKLSWGDAVTTHWPGFRLHDAYATRELTVRDLLTHRAGLGNADQLWYGRDRTRDDIIARIPLIEPAYSLRAGFVYQNIMYVAAGELAGRLTQSSWEDLVSTRLFQPLGMQRTVPTTTAAERSTNVARPHYRIEGQVEVIQNEILDSVAPAGAVWSSVSDMSRWLRMLLNEGQWNDQRILNGRHRGNHPRRGPGSGGAREPGSRGTPPRSLVEGLRPVRRGARRP